MEFRQSFVWSVAMSGWERERETHVFYDTSFSQYLYSHSRIHLWVSSPIVFFEIHHRLASLELPILTELVSFVIYKSALKFVESPGCGRVGEPLLGHYWQRKLVSIIYQVVFEGSFTQYIGVRFEPCWPTVLIKGFIGLFVWWGAYFRRLILALICHFTFCFRISTSMPFFPFWFPPHVCQYHLVLKLPQVHRHIKFVIS